MMPLHSPLSWTLVQHTVAPLTALVLLTAATVPEAPPSQPETETVAGTSAADGSPATLELEAVELAHELRAVPADDTDRLCARDDLRVSWTEPVGFEHGAHVGTIGPAPDADTVDVNGVVVCGDSTWAYMGFEAQRTEAGWRVNAVPYLEEDHGHAGSLNLDADPDPHGEARCQPHWGRPPAFPCHGPDEGVHDDAHGDVHDHAHQQGQDTGTPAEAPAPSPSAPTGRVTQSAWLAGLGPIEPYAAYEPQRSCSPTVKAGMGVVRDTLLGTHPQTRNLGIVRACHIGGRSEHKEGRAFDWGAYVNRPVEKAAVDRFLTQLFATDADGNTHALARRMGVMYVVWNGQIWASHRAQEGWRHYHGPNPHVDHVHISLSWAGGLGQTSFFTQDLASKGVLGLVPPGGTPLATDGAPVAAVPVTGQQPTSPSTGATSAPAPTGGDTSDGPSKDSPTRTGPSKDGNTNDGHKKDEPRTDTSPSPAPAPSPDDADADHARREAEKEQRRIEEEQRKAEEEQRRIEEQQRKEAERELQRQLEQQRREEEKQRRAEAKQAEQQAASTQRDETDTGSPGKGNGKGGGKGKR